MLGKLFRKKSLPSLLEEADALFAQAAWGEAKLAYDRIEERAQKEDPALGVRAAQQAATCCDRIADARLEAALGLAKEGQPALAHEELIHALETARGEAAIARIKQAMDALEQQQAVEQAAPQASLSDEERLALIMGAWESLQAQELESYGEALFPALLALDRGEAEAALAVLLPLAERTPEARYLWLEVGRAHLVRGDTQQAEAALQRFLAGIGPEEGGSARLLAHRELSRIAHERQDHDAAVAVLEACAEALGDDPRPYLDLGSYLRVIGRARDAVEVLELCCGLFPEGAIEWPVTLELGLACADAGDAQRAADALEKVLETLTSHGNTDLPPVLAVALAKLHEDRGNFARAADLYRMLTQGSDRDHHALYYQETARLLDKLDMAEEAARMRTRAAALAAS